MGSKPVIFVDTEKEKEEINELLAEIAERPQLYDSDEKEVFVDIAEVKVRDE